MYSVVIPTYNERDNVPELLERLSRTVSEQKEEYELLVIDDDSPDGTAHLARQIGDELGLNIRVVVRPNDPDLSRSVVRGFKEARGDVVVVMDADLQHPPEIVPELPSRVDSDTPIVVGTRYSNGGRIENWPLFRLVTSYGALILAKLFLPPARRVSDPVSGFFAVESVAIPFDEMSPDGYKILIELLATINPANVGEVGFTFEARAQGETSLDLEQYVRFIRNVIGARARFHRT